MLDAMLDQSKLFLKLCTRFVNIHPIPLNKNHFTHSFAQSHSILEKDRWPSAPYISSRSERFFGPPFDRMWFLSSVKACERPRLCLLCKQWVHEWRKWQWERKGRLPKGELHAKRQHRDGGCIRTIHFQAHCKGWTLVCGLLPRHGPWIPKCGHWGLKDGMHAEMPVLDVNLQPSARAEALNILYASVC